MLYLEDLNIADRFSSRKYHMGLEEIQNFAQAYDPQVFHTDEQQAAAHPVFQGIAASGWHTAAVVMRLWTECFPVAYGLIGSESHLRWPCPTRPGDEIHVEVEIMDIQPSRSKTDRGIVSYQTQAFDQHHKMIFSSTTKIVVFKRGFSPV